MTAAPSIPESAVRLATHRALEARDRLLADYPSWEAWRREVRAAKAEMVARRREYLALLLKQVKSWGGEVFFAADAAQARDFILGVAKRHGVSRAVQAKSMTAHEIGLAPFLARHGVRLTETDLGEFIIQLAGHPPAHLTAPALHLNRFQIARLLSTHLHLRTPSDPAVLTRLAADHLADAYGKADLGITGVNFAAVREGVLVCLENEGNLRLTASRPPVHLALMGWDKMLPGLGDLEPCLRLLPASATGQRLTSLVHFFKGLKAVPQGIQTFYLVILDNGRSRLAAHPELREALYCLRCGACLNICPVFQVRGAHLYHRIYPGAIGALLAPFLPPVGDISAFCTQCGSCAQVCPAAIELPQKIRHLRQRAPSFRRTRAFTWIAGLILGEPPLYRALETPLRAWSRVFGRRTARRMLGRELPPQSFHQLQQRFRDSNASAVRDLHHPGISRRDEVSPPESPSPARWSEAGTGLVSLNEPAAVAQYLRDTAQGDIWLEDHPLLRPVAAVLADSGIPAQTARQSWAPAADTAVTVGLGAVPELGAVVTAAPRNPSAWLPFKARRHVVLISGGQGNLSLPEALVLTESHEDPMVTWLTGPTRTADIEKILILGAQGPAELTLILYQPQAAGE